MELLGTSIIGSQRGKHQARTFQAYNPALGVSLSPQYHSAHLLEVNAAAESAKRAFLTYSKTSPRLRAQFLETIAQNIELLGSTLTERVASETGLPLARIQNETIRTCTQLRMFAQLVREGSWVDARIDRAQPQRQPMPRPDIRSMLRPMGPVAVFCASNFPLAFSVAGGDTVSALASGNTVVVLAHSAHPGTAEYIGTAIQKALADCQLPEGVFSLLYGTPYEGPETIYEVEKCLVQHPTIRAVAFTGSKKGGISIVSLASQRSKPIPVYAEMGSINPIFILPGMMKLHHKELAKSLYASIVLGSGQFCTNPGLIVVQKDLESSQFFQDLKSLMEASKEFLMLTPHLQTSYLNAVTARSKCPNVKSSYFRQPDQENRKAQVPSVLFETDSTTFLTHPELNNEIFGPSSLLVTYQDRHQMLELAQNLEGQLTASIHGTDRDLEQNSDLIEALEDRVGRLLFNGFPTGVEVCASMVHGGPFPATNDGHSSSVGTLAIERFCRPFCYQNYPHSLLPDELKDENPMGIRRTIDGIYAK